MGTLQLFGEMWGAYVFIVSRFSAGRAAGSWFHQVFQEETHEILRKRHAETVENGSEIQSIHFRTVPEADSPRNGSSPSTVPISRPK